MEVPEMPMWIEVVLAYASVVVMALTGLVSFVGWAAPRLRDISLRMGSKSQAGFFVMLEAAAHALSKMLHVICCFIPRLQIGVPKRPQGDGKMPAHDSADGKPGAYCGKAEGSCSPTCGTAAACDKPDCGKPAKPRPDDSDDDEDDDDPDDDPGAPGSCLIPVRSSFPEPKPSVPA